MRHFLTHTCLLLAILYAPLYAGAQTNDKLTGYGLGMNMFA
ncbi:hypothetical protein [Flavipsychrobacter stenotrophus]|nr:hypothetical protein [Flavipsychrobacter stenotrophus]